MTDTWDGKKIQDRYCDVYRCDSPLSLVQIRDGLTKCNFHAYQSYK